MDDVITKQEIIDGLKSLGVRSGMSLEVHSSLSSFGKVQGGANTIIEAVLESVGLSGNVVMPSFCLSKPQVLSSTDIQNGVTTKIKILDEQSSIPTGMGAIADTFRDRSDTMVGTGLFRVSAWGPEKEINSQSFSNLLEQNHWALLLGTDVYSLSAMHYVEEHLPNEIKELFKPSEKVNQLYDPDEWFIETWKPPVRAWHKIQDKVIAEGKVRQKKIGKSLCMLFKIQDMVFNYRDELIRDPYTLYGVSKPSDNHSSG